MNKRKPDVARCTYVVLLDGPPCMEEGLRDLAAYLSELSARGHDVVVIDGSGTETFEDRRRVLRWVSRHFHVGPESRSNSGAIDVVRAAAAVAVCDAIIVADSDVRYSAEAINEVCNLLEVHEVVEPQDYPDPLSWWGGVEAARILVHRAIEPQPDHGLTFGFRRSAVATIRALAPLRGKRDQPRRLAASGAEVFPATSVFVSRKPASLAEWVSSLPEIAKSDFEHPLRSAFFLSLLPLFIILTAFGGAQLAVGYASLLALISVVLALRGRVGASAFIPLRACFLAPLWIVERAVSVYWAFGLLLRRDQTAGATSSSGEAETGRRAAGRGR
ncbi:MAG TPA: hypothetical protein VF701_06090 [Thermoanaerobaculia bacterium]